ncbi:MAG: ABC transporter ATP-binding protein [Desulfobaccales bacterium]
MTAPDPAVLHLKNISRDFFDGRQLRRVLQPTDLKIYAGELTILAGPSGSGKTTLLSIMGMVLRPSEGRIILKARDITEYNDEQAATLRLKEYGYVFQQPLLIEGLTTQENVLLALGVQGGRVSMDLRQRSAKILESLGLGDTLHLQPRLLSGGQKQRASIARALMKNPSIILCDEPTSSLDAENGQVVLDILKRTAVQENRVVVVVSHDARVFPYGDRLIKLENGEVVSDTRESLPPLSTPLSS